MACPFFEPVERIEETGRWPLVDAWQGRCAATGVTPDRERTLASCNLGYARNVCGQFPDSADADAVRFEMQPSGRVRYILEREHFPASAGYCGESGGPLIELQAAAFRESHRRLAARAGVPAESGDA